jgi:hypothetical protein
VSRVATAGTATATASAELKFTGGTADSGSWTAGPVTETADSTLEVGSAAVIHQATCTFSFTGKLANVAVADVSPVTLKPKATKLRGGGVDVLLDGDSEQDTFGNKVSVSVPATSKLAST